MLKRVAYSGLALLPGILFGAESTKPNIIYILLDDAGIGDFSCYGQQKFKTPNIDRLAKEGMLFTDHYSGSTVCAPSRAILLTGLHSGHGPVRGNAEVLPVGQRPMSADTVTFAKVLQDNGYATGAFGKWGLGHPGSSAIIVSAMLIAIIPPGYMIMTRRLISTVKHILQLSS